MLSWFQALMPKEERFFDLFDRHAVTIVAGAHALRSLLDGDEKRRNIGRGSNKSNTFMEWIDR